MKSLKITDLINAFSNILNSLPYKRRSKKYVLAFQHKIFLTITFQWPHIVNKQLSDVTLLVKQYMQLITKFEQQKHLSFNEIYQGRYADG